jgi:AcrR family transcriptional regulator
MSGKTNTVNQAHAANEDVPGDRRARRRAATRAEIIDAAWLLVRQSGLAALSMRELGDRVGMRAQSVYSYFGSKDEIFDAMFLQGYEEYLETLGPLADAETSDVSAYLRAIAHGYFDFCVADPARFQLLFLRTVPRFEPSADSYAVAIDALGRLQSGFERIGITDPQAADLATAVMTGLASQQLANDPAGDRWGRLVDRAVSMVLAEVAPHLLVTHPKAPRPRRKP